MNHKKAKLRYLFFLKKSLAIHHGGGQLREEMEVMREAGGDEIEKKRTHP